MLRDFGVDPLEFAVKMGKHLTGKLPTKAERSLAERSFQEIINDTIQVEKYREPSQEELAQILIKLKTAAPEMRKILREASNKIPTKAGGRTRLLEKNNREARLCALISQQLAYGIEKPEAIKNAASRFDVSYWTAMRAWKRYQEAAKGKTASLKKKIQRTARRRGRHASDAL
jgi:hypothetical protein